MPYHIVIKLYQTILHTAGSTTHEFQSAPVQQKLCQDHGRAIFSAWFSHRGLMVPKIWGGSMFRTTVEVLPSKEPWKTLEERQIRILTS